MRWHRIAAAIGGILVALLVVAVAGVFVFTNTDWGRERTRRLLVSVVGKSIHGRLHVGALRGNLLQGAVLRDVSLTDSAGEPFFQAEAVQARYTLAPLLHRRLYFDHVTVTHPEIVLDRPPHGAWNFDRIVPRDTTHKGPPGFGSWIRLTNVKLVAGHILSRSPWAPAAEFTQRQRDSVIAYTLGPQGRQNVVRVPGGFQRIAEFRDVNGTFPLLQLADPKVPTQTIDVSALRMVALPMRPPAVQVRDVRGRFLVLHDSLYFHGMTAVLTGSRLAGDGRYKLDNNDLRLRLHVNPVATNDLLWVDPDIPKDGTGALDFALDWVGKNSDYQATKSSLRVAGATLSGALGMLVSGDTFIYHNTDMGVAHLDTRTIQQLFPTLRSPRRGFLTGRAAVAGSLSRLRMDGDMTFDDPISGRSRATARGILGMSKSAFMADNLHLTFSPFQVALARVFAPTLPVGGIVTGNALLTGSTARRLVVQADITHTDVTGDSHLVGSVAYAPGTTPWVNADLQLLPLSLATVGQFAPAAGLRGTVAGPVRVTGPLTHLTLDATLTTPDSGSVMARGTANLAGQDKAYDMVMATHLFDASSVTTKAPRTNVTANASVHGHGVTPETITAVVTADVKASTYDSVAVDSAIVRVSAANGVVHVDTLLVRVPHMLANAHGDFGLTSLHTGTIQYTAAVDSLGAFSRFLPRDTGVVSPRPGILEERLRRARADSIRVARATEVQRAITGQPGPVMVVDTPKTVPRSALLGAIQTAGVITGNLHAFTVNGTAHGTDLVALGNTVNVLSASYLWQNALTPQSYIGVGALASGVSAAGFAIDSIVAQASYSQHGGTVALAVRQDTNRTYDAKADYVLNQDRNELHLNELRVRLDSTVYATTRPTSIRFGPSGVDVDSLDIRTSTGQSRMFVDGHLPINGPANAPVRARFDLTNFNVANIASLLEDNVPVQGLVSIDAVVAGTAASPTLQGAFGTTRVTYRGTAVPEVHGTVAYSGQSLQTNAAANLEGHAPFLKAVGTLPIDLAMTGVTGSRFPSDRPLDVQIDADSLPLEHAPPLSDAITQLQGFATMHTHVTGTLAHPTAIGRLLLQHAGMTLVPAGVALSDVNGSIRLINDAVVIDSIVARSNGPIRLSGIVGFTTLADPTLALTLVANRARILGGDHGDLLASASLSLTGKLTAAVAKGQVQLLQGVIQLPEPNGKQLIGTDNPALFAVLDTSLAEHRDLFPTQSPLLKNLRANVGITVDRDVFVRSRAANVEIYTENPLLVTVNLRRQSFVVDGAVLSDRGEYRYQGRRFMIQRGSATFINTQQLDPTLQVTGAYTVQLPGREPIVIQIVISGTLEAPKIALTSNADPPISQTDLLSYLAFGQSSSSLLQAGGSGLTTGGSGSGNIVGRAAAVAQQQIGSAALGALTDQMAGQAAHALGADVFDITPADVSSDVGNFLRATQIEFGKYIQSRTYLGLQARPDPASLQRPGFELQQILSARRGYSLTASLSPRYLLQEPSLSSDLTPITTSVFGLFLVREWRY